MLRYFLIRYRLLRFIEKLEEVDGIIGNSVYILVRGEEIALRTGLSLARGEAGYSQFLHVSLVMQQRAYLRPVSTPPVMMWSGLLFPLEAQILLGVRVVNDIDSRIALNYSFPGTCGLVWSVNEGMSVREVTSSCFFANSKSRSSARARPSRAPVPYEPST